MICVSSLPQYYVAGVINSLSVTVVSYDILLSITAHAAQVARDVRNDYVFATMKACRRPNCNCISLR